MQQVTSADAQNRFGQLLDMAQREPVAITRHGRTAGYVIGPADMEILLAARGRQTRVEQDLGAYFRSLDAARVPGAPVLSEDDIAREIKAVRAQRRRAQGEGA